MANDQYIFWEKGLMMGAVFQKILVPVDFRINTEVAIKKSLEIIEQSDSVIHLLHVQKPVFQRNLHLSQHVAKRAKLHEWKSVIEEVAPGIRVNTDLVEARNIEKAIIEQANHCLPDIIVIGKNSSHSRFPFLNTVSPNRIAKETGFPVLTVKPGSIHNKVKSIVVPVGSFVPEKKMDLILALRKKFRISIHLVTILGNGRNEDHFSGYALLNTYRFLKNVAQCPLDHEVLHGENIARSTLKYAQEIKADMLLVDPEKEATLTPLLGKHISDELMPESRLQILTVQS